MFTVIVPTHKRPELLRRTLQSLIAQTYPEFTVIIVDDAASHIAPYDVLLALQGRYTYIIRSGGEGPAESRNMALKIVQSGYVLFLDDDDTLEPGHLQAIAGAIGASEPEILFCDFQVCDEDRTTSPPACIATRSTCIGDVTKGSVFIRNTIPNSCLVYRHDVVTTVRYDKQMLIYEDWDFLLECLKGHELTHVAINSVVIHKSSAGSPENMRRGNTRDDLIVETMLNLYLKHPAPDAETRLGRQTLMASAGITLAPQSC